MVSALDATGTLPLQWRDAFLTVPRHLFLPPVYWAATQDGYVRRDLYEESAPWLADAYADIPAVTQWDDGNADTHDTPTSSASPFAHERAFTFMGEGQATPANNRPHRGSPAYSASSGAGSVSSWNCR
jgi:hypothetical protein